MFSKTTQHGIKALLYLSKINRLANIREIAENTDSPESYLNKILQHLCKKKLVISIKGPHGGFRLAENAENIKLATIIQAIQGDDFFDFCALGTRYCDMKEPCCLHDKFMPIREEFTNLYYKTSLAEIAEDSVMFKFIEK